MTLWLTFVACIVGTSPPQCIVQELPTQAQGSAMCARAQADIAAWIARQPVQYVLPNGWRCVAGRPA